MRKHAVRMILTAVTVVALLMGVPGAIATSSIVWVSDVSRLESRAQTIARMIDRRIENGDAVTPSLVEALVSPATIRQGGVHASVSTAQGDLITVRTQVTAPTHVAYASTSQDTNVRLEASALPTIERIGFVLVLYLTRMGACMIVGFILALRFSRRLSAPLIYLAAQAEQIGSGQVRARVRPSGIEEIDLVQEELARTGERMAGRLAAEHRFASDASHQLRTPLTALSMRLEEIELISSEPEVQEEAKSCLEQVERLTAIVAELLDSNARNVGQTEAIHILEAFSTQREEWEAAFTQAGRELVFTDEAELPILADGGKVSQVLTTLIENSLHYDAGTTRVLTRKTANQRGVVVDVSDRGEGIAEDLTPDVFGKGVSGHGSTGIGLALAKDLAGAMGRRLELTRNRPPVFSLSLTAIPASLDPDRVMPRGPVVSMGRRSRRF